MDLLRLQSGQALCESLLRCHAAGKPYLYDPFNATRLVAFGRLDAKPLIEAIRRRNFWAVQFDGALGREEVHDQLAPEVLASVMENYQPLLVRHKAISMCRNPRPTRQTPARVCKERCRESFVRAG